MMVVDSDERGWFVSGDTGGDVCTFVAAARVLDGMMRLKGRTAGMND
jgi:hypothetical protein